MPEKNARTNESIDARKNARMAEQKNRNRWNAQARILNMEQWKKCLNVL